MTKPAFPDFKFMRFHNRAKAHHNRALASLALPDVNLARFFFRPALMIIAAILFAISAFSPSPAFAQCQQCPCISQLHSELRNVIRKEHEDTQKHIADQFEIFRQNFFLKFFFAENLLAAMRGMNEQMVSNGLLQVLAVGSFLDATHQIETQSLMQELTARAHKDYHPDVEMCAIGGAARSLGAAQFNSKLTTLTFARRVQDRQLNHGKTLASGQLKIDKKSRLLQMRKIYCNGSDHNEEMKYICNADPEPNASNRHNIEDRDIDYRSTMGTPLTLNIDFTNQTSDGDEKDEQHLFALSANLFGNDVISIKSPQVFKNINNHHLYVELRALAAKRSVASNSFATLAGMKSIGSEESKNLAPFAAKFYEQMGIPKEDIKKLLGERPSYFAQMDTLTRAIYQRPDFYVNLYTTPANVARLGASVRAINLMQNFDRFQSGLRAEILLSQILELELEQEFQDGLLGIIETVPGGDVPRTGPNSGVN